ncbi:hypothetical protein POVWA1_059920 [Plasmodium ovale wallikeri]|uniref:Uncharacterized protein n=1 Tax=Plasmodium ovale wallikeri TaxID=864142 RepID=A0A1A9A0J3_PLAOA|nr:hypothetical protein POVWA1_059920 [Plasmodium ovale wallikeri]
MCIHFSNGAHVTIFPFGSSDLVTCVLSTRWNDVSGQGYPPLASFRKCLFTILPLLALPICAKNFFFFYCEGSGGANVQRLKAPKKKKKKKKKKNQEMRRSVGLILRRLATFPPSQLCASCTFLCAEPSFLFMDVSPLYCRTIAKAYKKSHSF